ERPVTVLHQAQAGEEARHQDALAKVAEARLGPLSASERKRKLGIAAACRQWEREAAAEAWVDVGDEVQAVVFPKALDVGRADESQLLRHVAGELDQPLVADRHPLDRLTALRLDHRAWDRVQAPAVEVAEDVDRELLARETRLHDRINRGVAEEEAELSAVVGAVDVPRAETAACLDEQ